MKAREDVQDQIDIKATRQWEMAQSCAGPIQMYIVKTVYQGAEYTQQSSALHSSAFLSHFFFHI